MKVEVTFFKPRGKYYTTESIEWLSSGGLIHDEFKTSLRKHLKDRLQDTLAVCIEPTPHEHCHPLMVSSW